MMGGIGRRTTFHPFICPSIYSSIYCLFSTYCFLDALLGTGAKPVSESTQFVEFMRETILVCRTGAGVGTGVSSLWGRLPQALAWLQTEQSVGKEGPQWNVGCRLWGLYSGAE